MLPIAVCLLDAQGAIVDANTAAVRMLGDSSNLTSRPHLQTFLPSGEQERFQRWLTQGGADPEYYLDFPLHAGETQLIQLRAVKIPNQIVQGPYYLVTLMDAPLATPESKSDLIFQSSILDSIGEAVIATDLAGTILYWNKAAESIYGWTAAEAIGRDIVDLTAVDENRALGLEIMASLQHGGGWSGEFMVRHRQGHHFLVHVTDSCLRDQLGRLSVIIGVSKDLTEKKRLESKLNEQKLALAMSEMKHLEDASRFKSEFLANMSHEVRTPLSVIRGYAEILVDEIKDAETRARIQAILQASRQIETLVNDILDITKVEAGKVEVEEVPTALIPLVDDVRSMLEGKARDKHIGFHVHLDPQLPTLVRTDPLRLKQILLNLAGNAIKFTERGDVQITVSLIQEGLVPRLAFQITDSGIGMTPEQSQNIFRPFGQADASISRRYGGTGLGLTLSSNLAALMGGRLALEKTAPGQGSTFLLTLPCVEVKISPQSKEPLSILSGTEPQLSGLRILVVEDASDVRAIVRKFLEKEEAQISEAVQGEEGARLAREQSFDVILMDLQMPVCNGFQALRRMKDEGFQGPIFALTAHAMAGERERCLAAGFSGYFTKPIQFKEMIAVLKSWRDSGLQSPS